MPMVLPCLHRLTLTTMAPPLRLQAVAFVSPQNQPILVRTFNVDPNEELKYHYLSHTSLDVFEERSVSHAMATILFQAG
jgi:hypothetical protein